MDFLVHLERTFQIAFGHDSLTSETRDTLLHGQLQHGLNTDNRVLAVSGSQSFMELCIAARNEKKQAFYCKKNPVLLLLF